MITISLEGKTYIARRSKMSMLLPISEWIEKGFLEEVKENKELIETLEPINNDWAKEAGRDFAKNKNPL